MTQRLKYIILTILLILVEVLIALFVHDRIVRPYGGDIIVVIVVYCFVRIFIPEKCRWLPLGVFVFACGIELLQKMNLVELLGVADNPFLRTLFGSVFDIKDVLCYLAGCILLGVLEIWRYRSDEMKARGGE